MAVYKPSNFYPSSQEVDLTKDNIFTCQVNTSGESIKAYKIKILSRKGDETLAYIDASSGPVSNGVFGQQGYPIILNPNIKNKGIIKSVPINSTTPVSTDKTGVNTLSQAGVVNGKDYQWGIRVYNALPRSTAQPNTLVCEGFLVGSTRYVIWCKINDSDNATTLEKRANENIQYDRYIEFETTGPSQMFDILEPNPDNIKLPAEGEVYRERHKIDWVTKGLGYLKNYTKIECDDSFKYNYKRETPFKIYQCSDQHTLNSVYADPNGNIKSSNWIIIYNNASDAQSAHNAGDSPSKTTVTPREKGRKIIGYSSVTGEIRVGDAFDKVPENGNAYLVFEYDNSRKEYKEITLSNGVSNVIGGEPITGYNSYYKIDTNHWGKLDPSNPDSPSLNQLFIQPNINIKSDDTNPDEIVFDDGTRLDIVKKINSAIVPGKNTDITINTLDNTQWLITWESSYVSPTGTIPPIIPKSDYKVYTDFMDSQPLSIFYARKEPLISIDYQNLNTVEPEEWKPLNPLQTFAKDVVEIDGTEIEKDKIYIEYRDIKFKGLWGEGYIGIKPQIKYYHYYLYVVHAYTGKEEFISESEDIYDDELIWYFRGFDGTTIEDEIVNAYNPRNYRIVLKVVDEYDKEYVQIENVPVYYQTNIGVVSLKVEAKGDELENGENDCSVANERGIRIICNAPVFVMSTDLADEAWTGKNGNGTPIVTPTGIKETVDNNDLGFKEKDHGKDYWVTVPSGEILNYTRLSEQDIPIILPEQFYYYSHFQILGDFIDYIKPNGKLKVWEVAHIKKVPSEEDPTVMVDELERYTLALTDANSFYQIVKNGEYNFVQNWAQCQLRLYRNYIQDQPEADNPALNCFYDAATDSYIDHFDILTTSGNNFSMPTFIKYAIQKNEGYIVTSYLPQNYSEIENDKKYVLTNKYLQYNPDIYIYNVNLGTWEIDTSTQYVFVTNLNQVQKVDGTNYTFDELGVPEHCRGNNGTILQVLDNGLDRDDPDYENYDYLWVDSRGFIGTNKAIFNTKWVESLLVIKDGINEAGVTCELEVGDRGLITGGGKGI